ncbi:hypothetical protein [Nocardioides jejuensis]|uniref:Uncharacterized protein n=1 Tax=Nocardioides jejuensis TaxID=2502782 RepID=A0A4R1BY83_9ACTN|nr:hypothetical protein [Nocardioides jejuensis]TCJ23044.1 hypothetical protein EPD65_11825 [Nocardioides jejuensis]
MNADERVGTFLLIVCGGGLIVAIIVCALADQAPRARRVAHRVRLRLHGRRGHTVLKNRVYVNGAAMYVCSCRKRWWA